MVNSNHIIEQYKDHVENGGSTWRNGENLRGQKLFSVGIGVEQVIEGKNNILASLNAFVIENKLLVRGKNRAIGTWYDELSEKTYFDIVLLIPNHDQEYASTIAKHYSEIAYFNLETGETIYI